MAEAAKISGDVALWRAIYALYKLLSDEVNEEVEYQRFFELHPVVFKVLGFDHYASFEKSSGNKLPYDPDRQFTPEPDFLCATTRDCLLTVFELKTPFVRTITVRGSPNARHKLNSDAESYISQTTEYADSIREHSGAREVVTKALHMPNIAGYEIVLVFGRGKNNDREKVTSLLQNRKIPTRILFYDDLLEKMIATYESFRKVTAARAGGAALYHLLLPESQRLSRAFISDHGEFHKNRLSLYIENETLHLWCVDNRGRSHLLSAPIPVACPVGPVQVLIEWANDKDGIYISLSVDNEEKDLRVGAAQFEFVPSLEGLVVGADLSGANSAVFYMLEFLYTSETMSAMQRLGCYRSFREKWHGSMPGLFFNGSMFLKRRSDGALIQEVAGRGPIYRNPIPDPPFLP